MEARRTRDEIAVKKWLKTFVFDQNPIKTLGISIKLRMIGKRIVDPPEWGGAQVRASNRTH